MLRNYIKTAWRNLHKNRFYSLINIGGLTVGLAVGILILLWVEDEFSFDRFHSQANRIYKLENIVGTGTSRQLWTYTTSPIGMLAKKEIPGVENAVRVSHYGFFNLFKANGKSFIEKNFLFTDPSFFSVFDFKLLKGNPQNPFPDAHSIILTQSAARKYFGSQDPIGKAIQTDRDFSFKVTGLVADFPENSSIRADLLLPLSLVQEKFYAGRTDGQNLMNDFNQFSYDTYLLLSPGTSVKGLTDKIRQIHLRNKSDDTDIAYVLLPLIKMHLFHSDGSEGGYATVRMFLVIAILVLIIACINYVNLSTARSMLRAREVSLRKIVGAARVQLFLQFILETTLLFLIAAMLALGLAYVLTPYFNDISGKQLVFSFANPQIWKTVALTIIGTLVISSVYPALLLSSYEPIRAFRGKISSRISNALFRKALVVTQFTVSVVLIIGTLVIGRQMHFIRTSQPGYNRAHVFSVSLLGMRDHLEAVRNDLLKQPGVKAVTWANADIVEYDDQTGNNNWDGKEEGETLMLSPFNIGANFIPFFDMKIIQGKGLTGTPEDKRHLILNETAVKATRLKNPIGKKFRLQRIEGTIVGVVQDFHFASLRHQIDPAVFYYEPGNYNRMYVKTTGKEAPLAIAAVGREWQKYNAEYPFSYSFLDDTYNNLYKGEARTASLFNIFSVIAIIISCLGLLGLAAFTAQVRKREIGVRKVLGASVNGITRLLAADFIRLVLGSIVLAVPVAWYLMSQWLADFAYRINMPWWVFVVAGGLALLVAFATISYQAIRAAVANPVKSLRTD